MTTTDNMEDISLHIATDSSSPLPEKLYNFFQPETLEGENAFWCEDCQKPRRVTKTLSYTHIPTILIVHLKRLILPGEKIQNHIPFDTTLEMEPFMAPGLGPAQKNRTDWHDLTRGGRKTWALCRSNKKRETLDTTQRCLNNLNNTSTLTPITGVHFDIQENKTKH